MQEMAFHIKDLPAELFIHVLKKLLECSSSDIFLRCIQCCRHWYETGIPILYENIIFKLDNRSPSRIKRFLSQCANLERIRSITFDVDSNSILAGPATIKHLIPFSKRIVPRMSFLTTFSLVITGEHRRRWGIYPKFLTRILRALPTTVVNLELDTLGLDFNESNTIQEYYLTLDTSGTFDLVFRTQAQIEEIRVNNHICAAVGAIIPRLHHLRLRISTLCPKLLCHLSQDTYEGNLNHNSSRPRVYSSLRSAIIRLDPCSNRPPTHRCGTDTVCPEWHDENYMTTGAELKSNLRKLYEAGAFPNLRLLKIVQLEPSDPNEDLTIAEFTKVCNIVAGSESQYPKFFSAAYLEIHDIILDSVTTLPFLRTEHLYARLREDSGAATREPLWGSDTLSTQPPSHTERLLTSDIALIARQLGYRRLSSRAYSRLLHPRDSDSL